MKKIILINRKNKNINNGEQISIQGYNLVLSDSSSIIDLSTQLRDTLINNDKIRFKVISWCMFPVIWAGDILKIEPIKPEDVRIGDIVLYKSLGRAYCHRLVKTYIKKDVLYIVTSGEKEYKKNRFSDYGGIAADNILGKVVKVKRGKLCFKTDEKIFSLGWLIKGRLKLSLWTSIYKIKQYIAKIFINLQGIKSYRYFLKIFLKNKISFFGGTPLIKNTREINNFCSYQRFEDFLKDFTDAEGLYNISARIDNRPVGNISLYFEKINNYQVCMLANLMVNILFRGGGIGGQLLGKALYLCDKINVEEIKIELFEEDNIAIYLFKKMGFEFFK